MIVQLDGIIGFRIYFTARSETELRKPRLLWIDDEIDHLESLLLFLERKGYFVARAPGGRRGIEMLSGDQAPFDLVLLDQVMPGMDGIETLEKIRGFDSGLPVIMVTKSEDELTMDEAFGRLADDYLIKPVKPQQILSVLKKHLDRSRLREVSVSDSFAARYLELLRLTTEDHDWTGWAAVAGEVTRQVLDMDHMGAAAEPMVSSLAELRASIEPAFAKFIEREYEKRITSDAAASPAAPPMSHEIIRRKVFPHLAAGKKTALVVMDCMRLDQWIVLERALRNRFDITRDICFSILPTATPYSRNAIFAGQLPEMIENRFPGLLSDEDNPNRFEKDLLEGHLRSSGFDPDGSFYTTVHSESAGKALADRLPDYSERRLLVFVYSFMDILTHSRSESRVLQDMIPDEKAFRHLAESWFEYSQIRRILENLGRLGYTIVCTSDHGSIQCTRAARVVADRSTTSHLRYKRGTNIKTGDRYAVNLKNPKTWGLPAGGIMTNYLIAKEDYFLIYANDFTAHRRLHSGSFLHGGISLDEMVIPCATLVPR